MKWSIKRFTRYKKFFFEFNFQDTEVYLVIKKRHLNRGFIYVTWRFKKYPSLQFSVFGPQEIVFKNLQTYFTHSCNPTARKSMDRILEASGKVVKYSRAITSSGV